MVMDASYPDDRTCLRYAYVKTSTSGTRTVEFSTTQNTKAQKYTIRVETERLLHPMHWRIQGRRSRCEGREGRSHHRGSRRPELTISVRRSNSPVLTPRARPPTCSSSDRTFQPTVANLTIQRPMSSQSTPGDATGTP